MARIVEYFKTAPTLTAAGTGTADVSTQEVEGDISGATHVECQLVSSAPAGSPGTPTCTGTLQSSIDGTNWEDLITFTETTTSASAEMKGAVAAASVVIGSKLRLKASVGTASGTATYTLVFHIIAKA